MQTGPSLTSSRRFSADIIAVVLLLVLVILFYHKIAIFNQILVGYDIFTYFYPQQSYAADTLRQLHLPLWNPYLFTGAPFLANVQTAVLYPFNVVFLLFPVPRAFAYSAVLHVFLGACFTFLFARISLKLGTTAAFVTATVFALSGFVNSLVGHINQLHVAIWLPLLLLLLDRSYRLGSVRWALLAGLVLAVQFTAGHTQESYLTLFALALFLGFQLVRDTREFSTACLRQIAGKCLLFLMVVAVGAGLAAVQLVPAYELSRLSIRSGGMSYKEAVSFSLPPTMVLKSFLPVFGDPQPFSEWLAYVGIIPLALATIAIAARWRRWTVVFALLTCIVAIFFAFGQYNPLYPLAYKLVPGLNLFRVPARWLYLYTFGAAILAGVGADIVGQFNPRLASADRTRQIARQSAKYAFALFLVVAGFFTIGPSIPLEMPGQQTIALWIVLGVLAIGLSSVGLFLRRGRIAQALLAALLIGELFVASVNLDLNQGNVEEAYSGIRPAVAHFLADSGLYRILPLSENDFEPGDLKEMKDVLGTALSPERVYDYVVTVKEKETLMPNLPLQFRLATLDGYDGGLLPLKRYVDLKELFPRQTRGAPDARLREELTALPDSKLLGWLNVKYVLMDRTRDVWMDGVYYDLALTQPIDANTRDLVLQSNLTSFDTTSIGIISHLNGAEGLADGAEVALVKVTDVSGETFTAPLRVGLDTSEGRYAALGDRDARLHRQARQAKSWKGEPNAWDYAAKVVLPKPMLLKELSLQYVGPSGRFNLRGVSLIDDRTQTSYPVVISDALKFVHVGDVKIYENRDWLPRAFLAFDTVLVDSDQAALSALRDSPPGANGRIVLVTNDLPGIGKDDRHAVESPLGSPGSAKGSVEIVTYEPERIVINAELGRAGFLVLTDSYYPGWRVWVDGSEGRILRANYMFRGVPLDPGQHTVEFRFDPDSLRLGAWLSLATTILAFGVFARFR